MTGRSRRQQLEDIQRVSESLKAPMDCPDFTLEVLERVHQQRPFLNRRTRRWLVAGRYLLGASLVAVIFAVVMVQRAAPEQTAWRNRPAPMTKVVDAVESTLKRVESEAPILTLRNSFLTVRESIPSLAMTEAKSAPSQFASGEVRTLSVSVSVVNTRFNGALADPRLPDSMVWLDGRLATCADCMLGAGLATTRPYAAGHNATFSPVNRWFVDDAGALDIVVPR